MKFSLAQRAALEMAATALGQSTNLMYCNAAGVVREMLNAELESMDSDNPEPAPAPVRTFAREIRLCFDGEAWGYQVLSVGDCIGEGWPYPNVTETFPRAYVAYWRQFLAKPGESVSQSAVDDISRQADRIVTRAESGTGDDASVITLGTLKRALVPAIGALELRAANFRALRNSVAAEECECSKRLFQRVVDGNACVALDPEDFGQPLQVIADRLSLWLDKTANIAVNPSVIYNLLWLAVEPPPKSTVDNLPVGDFADVMAEKLGDFGFQVQPEVLEKILRTALS